MSEQQAISTGLEVLKLIAAGGIGGTVASCIGNWFVNNKLQTQKHEHDKQIESLKSKLGKKNTVHKLQFEKEFQLYGELWKALVVVRKTAVITPTLDTIDELPYEEKYKKAVEAFNKAKNLFEDHRPFYHDDVSKITRDLLSQCRGYIGSVGQMLNSENFNDELYDKADDLLKKVPEAIDEIEKVIKGRIGLLREAEIVE
ncbi:MAG TPA: hypothetical protein DDW84_01655 [Phycisphaerales bacterium]|nr:MAG: hypothetical protein A2Y13_01000 [Planctomycetes bacterium GWC2_45_44]HBG77542.1 hypothetical protein [Phycisphaerales bacterium]HBR19770.1 hypothetical protein [Phycisphaerales bacterium]